MVARARAHLDHDVTSTVLRGDGRDVITTPDLQIELNWDVGDEKRALTVLTTAVDIVARQLITDTGMDRAELLRRRIDELRGVLAELHEQYEDPGELDWSLSGFVESHATLGVVPLGYRVAVIRDAIRGVGRALGELDARLNPKSKESTEP